MGAASGQQQVSNGPELRWALGCASLSCGECPYRRFDDSERSNKSLSATSVRAVMPFKTPRLGRSPSQARMSTSLDACGATSEWRGRSAAFVTEPRSFGRLELAQCGDLRFHVHADASHQSRRRTALSRAVPRASAAKASAYERRRSRMRTKIP